MTNIEQTGKTVEEATQLALEQLGVTEDEVDVEILDEGAKGFLGLGHTPAKVRVTLKRLPPAVKAEEKPEPRPRPRPRPRPKPKPEAEPKPERKPERRPKPPVEQKPKPEAEAQPKAPAAPAAQAPAMSEESLKQAAETAREVLQKILDGIGVGGTVAVKSAEGSQVGMEVKDGDAAILIGRHGQTIDALQYLVSVITSRKSGSKVRLNIDVEGYRTRREEALKNQALYLADKVKQSGQEAVLEPLPPNERRIIHTALANDPDVYTYSEGQEPERYVVISPQK